jgi:hypothetical protein
VTDPFRDLLAAAPPEFAPLDPAAIRSRVRRRRLGLVAVPAVVVAVLVAVLVPRLALDPVAAPPPATRGPTPSPVVAQPPCPVKGTFGGIIDYIAAVRFGGRQYIARGSDPGQRPARGEQVGVVRCSIADAQVPDYRMRDGDSTYLPVGTRLYATRGLPFWFRLVAADGQVFESMPAAGARTGAEVLPLRGLVRSIEVSDQHRLITDPATVRTVVDGLAAAPVRRGNDWVESGTLVFRLTDGTTVTRLWSRPHGIVEGGIVLPPSAVAALG